MVSLLVALSLLMSAPVSCPTQAQDPLLVEADGYYHPVEHRVAIDSRLCRALALERQARQQRLLTVNPELPWALFVTAHERAHALLGVVDECEADRIAYRTLPRVAVELGLPASVGRSARLHVTLNYCSGRVQK